MDPEKWSKFDEVGRLKVWREVLHKENAFYDMATQNTGKQLLADLEAKLQKFDEERAEAHAKMAEMEKNLLMGTKKKAGGTAMTRMPAAQTKRRARVRALEGEGGWTLRESRKCPDLFYYHNPKTNETRWDAPPDLRPWTPKTPK